jgi:putative acetyltransferase
VPSQPVTIRPESSADFTAIGDVVAAAFDSVEHADLVERIRSSREYVADMALVAVSDGEVVGHVMISHATVRAGAADRRIAMLSPLAVRPDRQRQGVGGELVRCALVAADERGEPFVVLEGRPTYYARFGFEPSTRYGVVMPLPDWAPPEAGQLVRLAGFDADDDTMRGTVVYPAAFDGFE